MCLAFLIFDPNWPFWKDYSLCMGYIAFARWPIFKIVEWRKMYQDLKTLLNWLLHCWIDYSKFRPSFNSETLKSFQSSSFNKLSLWQQIVQVNDLTSGIETSSYLLFMKIAFVHWITHYPKNCMIENTFFKFTNWNGILNSLRRDVWHDWWLCLLLLICVKNEPNQQLH